MNFISPTTAGQQVIDTVTGKVTDTLQPGAVSCTWSSKGHGDLLSARDDNKVVIYDTASKQQIGGFASASPSGIFNSPRAARIGPMPREGHPARGAPTPLASACSTSGSVTSRSNHGPSRIARAVAPSRTT